MLVHLNYQHARGVLLVYVCDAVVLHMDYPHCLHLIKEEMHWID